MKKFLIVFLLISSIFFDSKSQSINLQGIYQCTGYIFHPTSSRTLNLSKNIIQVSANRYQVSIADLGSSYTLQFDVDANNNLVNWVAIGSTPASPASGFMSSDNPGAFSFYPGATSGFVSSIYNNKYNPTTKTFYLHYGYQSGATAQNQYQRQVYEKYLLTAGKPTISTYSSLYCSYGTPINLTGKNFTGIWPSFGGDIRVDSFSIVSDSVLKIWPGGGTNSVGRLFISNSFSSDSTPLLTYVAPNVVNTTWQYAGSPGFAAISSPYGMKMAITKTNVPYVAFCDSVNKARVMKYTASTNSWSLVGSIISAGTCSQINIKLDNANVPYVTYIDSANGNKITVKKLSGSTWVNVGTPGFLSFTPLDNQNPTQLALDGANIPYVLGTESINGINSLVLYKWSSTTWAQVGTYISQDFIQFSLDIDKASNTPYVLFDNPNTYQLNAMKYASGVWIQLGAPDFTSAPNGVYYPSIQVDKTGTPSAIMQYDDNHERLSFYKFNGNAWSNTNGDRFSKGHSFFPSLIFDKNNRPVVAFNDYSYNGKTTVMTQKNSGQWTYVGDRGFQPGNAPASPGINSLSIDTTNTPYIAFIDQQNSNRLSVMKYRSTLTTSITNFSPTAAATGSTITIKGIGFTGARAIKFNNTAATSFTVVNDSTITAILGAGSSGAINITTVDGGIASKDGFVFCTTPSITSNIIGAIDVCSAISGDTISVPVLYYIPKVANAVSYNWTMPAGASVYASADTAVWVRFSRSFVSGSISVAAINICGQTSSSKTLVVYKRVAASPTIIQKEFVPSTAAVTSICGLTSEVYKIRKVAYATSYDWRMKVGTGATITHLNTLGENDTAVRISFSTSVTKDTLSVAAISACSVGTPTYVYVSATGTVAGGNGQGSALNQLNSPQGVFVDKNGNQFICDHSNHRIVKWAPGASIGVVVAGGNGQGSALNQLNYPGAVVVDSLGRIYVSDNSNHRVVRWQAGITNGTVVAGGNGIGSAANQLAYPHGIFLDASLNIYVTDDNNRVQKWAPGSITGVTVAGGNGAGFSANQLNYPYAVIVDKNGSIIVADRSNHRIQKFAQGSTTAVTIAGGNGQGYLYNQLSYPTNLFIDSIGSVYICDDNNNRIQKLLPYEPNLIVNASKTLALSALLAPPVVSTISGSTTPCIGNSIVYSATSTVPTATQSSINVFRWTKPNNTSIVAAAADSSSITLKYNIGFTGGTISAKGQSACNVQGTAKTITLQYLPPTPTGITSRSGTYNACIGDTITYTAVIPLPSVTQRPAVIYRWTKPNNTQIISAAADSSFIKLKFNTGYIGGAITVKGQTICGAQGSAKSVTLTHTTCAVGTKILPLASNEDDYFKVYPNPSKSDFKLYLKISQNPGSLDFYQSEVIDLQGRVVKKMLVPLNQTFNFGSDLKSGVYLLKINQEGKIRQFKIAKF